MNNTEPPHISADHDRSQCELIPILKGWVKDMSLPVDVSNGGWITYDMGKWVLARFNCTSVVMLGAGKTVHIGDPAFFDEIYAGIKAKVDYLQNRSRFRKWLEDPGD